MGHLIFSVFDIYTNSKVWSHKKRQREREREREREKFTKKGNFFFTKKKDIKAFLEITKSQIGSLKGKERKRTKLIFVDLFKFEAE